MKAKIVTNNIDKYGVHKFKKEEEKIVGILTIDIFINLYYTW